MAINSWIAGSTPLWGSAGSWLLGIPIDGQDVVITADPGAAYSVLLFAPSAAIDSLTIGNASGATLFLNSATLDVTGTGAGATDTLDVLGIGTVLLGTNSIVNASNITLDTATSLLEGDGVVTGALSGSGAVLADGGGDLRLETAIADATGLQFTIGDTGNNTLQVDAAVGAGNTFTFQTFNPSFSQTFAYNSAASITVNIIGLDVGSSATAPANSIDFRDHTVTVTGDTTGSGTTGTITLSDGSTLTLSGITNSPGSWFVDTVDDGAGGTKVFLADVVCYARGTLIQTADGERPVETLRPGNQVITLVDGEEVPRTVRWLGHRRIDLTAHPRPETVAPIRIRSDAFADNIPRRDLLVSPDHAIFVDGMLICARQLVNGTTIRQEKGWTAADYYHVELDRHAILLAEGLPAESYLDTGNRGFFANGDAPLTLHPDLTTTRDHPNREAGSCAPFVFDDAAIRPVWRRLAERAEALGHVWIAPVTTDDPGLRLLAGGRSIAPVTSGGGRYVFALPAALA